MKVTQSVSVLRCKDAQCEQVDDLVAQESVIRIVLRDSKTEENFASIHTIPTDFESLIIGLLFSSRIITSTNDITQIQVRNQLAKVQLKDACEFQEKLRAIRPTARIVMGLCGPEEGALGTWQACDVPPIETSHTVSTFAIQRAIQNLTSDMTVYRQTGGTHGAALVNVEGTVVRSAEDVGRHNAVDRVIGQAVQSGVDLSDLILVCSGRLTGDLVLKAAVAQIPFVASISAGVSSGIELAEAAGITLIGFVRGTRMNIYTHSDRVIVLKD
ncbi:MAG: formate dehydrogenase accessory sulfurtransferase FdhD [Candidatus Thorarchaeota archaeon]